MISRLMRFLPLACLLGIIFVPSLVFAQSLTLNMGDNAPSATTQIVQMIGLVTILSLAPSILVMMTSFTRIIIVLSLLRNAIGTQQTPPNVVLISLALFMTFFIMAPTLQKSYDTGLKPMMEGTMETMDAIEKAGEPLHAFMMQNVRPKDVSLFMDIAKLPAVEKPSDTPFRVLIPAFMISELKRAFEIGFLLFLPFLIIDMVVASILMAMGMMMLPPVTISLPFKIIFFVLVDGWYLVTGSLLQSYGVAAGAG
jgi:flagellar biosynthesis protein FliP